MSDNRTSCPLLQFNDDLDLVSTVTDTAFQNDKGALCRTSTLNGSSLFCFAARDGFAQSIDGALLSRISRFLAARGQMLCRVFSSRAYWWAYSKLLALLENFPYLSNYRTLRPIIELRYELVAGNASFRFRKERERSRKIPVRALV